MAVPRPDEARRAALHRALPVGGLLLFSPAVLVAFDRAATLLGVPVLLVYLFGALAIGIGLTAWLAAPGEDAPKAGGPGEAETRPPGTRDR